MGQTSVFAWRMDGALKVSCAAVYVARPGMPYDPLILRPNTVAAELRDAAEQIIHAKT